MAGTSKSGVVKPDAAQVLESLGEMVAEGSVRRGAAADSVCGVMPELYVEPADDAEVARVLRYANDMELQVVPRGGGSKLAWGNAPQATDLVISTARLNRVLEYAPADMTVTVGAGTTFAELQRTLSRHGQRLALDPLWPEQATIGGVVATNDSGGLRVRYGGVRDLIIGITVVLADGTIAASGGKVVKNVAGYDLPKLIAGSFGTLGIIVRAVFRLHPLPESSQTLTWKFSEAKAANEFILAIADSLTVPTGLQMRAESAKGEMQVDVRYDGIPSGIAAQFETARKLAAHAENTMPVADAWQAREQLWASADSAKTLIVKLSVLPTSLAAIADFIRRHLNHESGWKLLMNSTGLAWLHVDSGEHVRVAEFVSTLRGFVAGGGGTAVIVEAPAEVRGAVDVWGDAGSALPLMRSIKHQFDRNAILNRGRFVGGI